MGRDKVVVAKIIMSKKNEGRIKGRMIVTSNHQWAVVITIHGRINLISES